MIDEIREAWQGARKMASKLLAEHGEPNDMQKICDEVLPYTLEADASVELSCALDSPEAEHGLPSLTSSAS